MAQPKHKKKTRSRSDPARREAAARRDEARRLAADERRREQEAAERRAKARKTIRRLAMPVLVGLGVVVAAVFLFRPQPELAGVEKVDTAVIMAGLGYVLPADIEARIDSLPTPACGVVPDLTTEQLYSDLRNGAVVLFHRSEDAATATALETLLEGYETHVVVAPNDRITHAVLAVAWERRMGYASADDPGPVAFTDTYRKSGRAGADCPITPGTGS